MSRMIRIETCNHCHFKKIVSGFDRINAYRPHCENSVANKTGRYRLLGFTMETLTNGVNVPAYDGIIPDWCPLEKITQPEEK